MNMRISESEVPAPPNILSGGTVVSLAIEHAFVPNT